MLLRYWLFGLLFMWPIFWFSTYESLFFSEKFALVLKFILPPSLRLYLFEKPAPAVKSTARLGRVIFTSLTLVWVTFLLGMVLEKLQGKKSGYTFSRSQMVENSDGGMCKILSYLCHLAYSLKLEIFN